METGNTARISKEILPEEITKTTYTYSNDGDELHQFNLYKTADAQCTKSFPLIIDIMEAAGSAGIRIQITALTIILHQAGITYLHSLIEQLTAVPSVNR